MDWIATREAGLERLEEFLPRARDYARARNFDRGPADRSNVSLLSPYLRHRLVTEEEVWRAVSARHPGSAAEKFLQEVVWRTYWKGWLERRPQAWEDWLARLPETDRSEGLEEARLGRTGIGPFDEWARELVEHGYLHNHARMWFASIWIFTLRLPWEAGAAFFLEHLLDGDPASNTLGWRWVAGLQTPGKHYLARAANIRRYTEGRLDPGTSLDESAEALPSGPRLHEAAAELPPTADEDPPRVDDGLFLTTDDLAPETLFSPGAFRAVAGGRPETGVPGAPPESPRVRTFREEAVRSTLDRSRDQTGRSGVWLGSARPERIAEWAREAGVERVWVAHAPVGPTRSAVGPLRRGLSEAGMRLRLFARSWDRRLHPHAKAGFFRFKKETFPLLDAEVSGR